MPSPHENFGDGRVTSRSRAGLATFGSTLALATVAVVASVSLATAVVRRMTSPAERAPAAVSVPDWERYAVGGQQLGSSGSVLPAVTIVAFSDFQCPYCRRLAGELRSLQQSYDDRVGVVYRYFPLHRIHKHAAMAAVAATCASEQGQFDRMHDLLFDHQDSIGVIPWVRFARLAGVRDSSTFAACLSSPRARARVRHDVALGDTLGVRGTPTVLVNGARLSGAPDRRTLDAVVQAALRATKTREADHRPPGRGGRAR